MKLFYEKSEFNLNFVAVILRIGIYLNPHLIQFKEIPLSIEECRLLQKITRIRICIWKRKNCNGGSLTMHWKEVEHSCKKQTAVKVKIHFYVVNFWLEPDTKWTEKFKMPISGAFQIYIRIYFRSIVVVKCNGLVITAPNLAEGKTIRNRNTCVPIQVSLLPFPLCFIS